MTSLLSEVDPERLRALVQARQGSVGLPIDAETLSSPNLLSTTDPTALAEVTPVVTKPPIGAREAFARMSLSEKIPFVGTVIKGVKLYQIKWAMERLVDKQNDLEYQGSVQSTADAAVVGKYLNDREELSSRGTTFGADLVDSLSELPAFVVEFAATGGIASLAKKGVRVVGIKALERALESGVSRAAWAGAKTLEKGTEFAAGAVARTAAMPGRVMAGAVQNEMPDARITPEGTLELIREGDRPFTAWVKSFGDTWAENFSEVMGPSLRRVALRAPLAGPALARIGKGIESAYVKAGLGKVQDFVRKVAVPGGFDGILEEMGEERVGDAIRATLGIQDFGADNPDSVFSRLYASIPDGRQLATEFGTFAVWGGVMGGLGASLTAHQHKAVQSFVDSIPALTKDEVGPFAQQLTLTSSAPTTLAVQDKLAEVALRSGMERDDYNRTLGPWVAKVAALYEVRNGLQPGEFWGTKSAVELWDNVEQAARAKAEVKVEEKSLAQDAATVREWHLKSEGIIDKFPFKSIKAAGLLNELRKKGVTDDELQWTGLGERLTQLGQQQVTRDEVQGYLKRGYERLTPTTEVLGEPKKVESKAINELAAAEHAADTYRNDDAVLHRLTEARIAVYEETGGTRENYLRIDNRLRELEDKAANTTTYDKMTQSEKDELESLTEDYTNILDTIGNAHKTTGARWGPGGRANITLPGEQTNYREILLAMPVVPKPEIGEGGVEYRSPHWDQPNNYLHVRVSDRVIDGKRTLFVEEVQSDWIQGQEKFDRGIELEKQIVTINKQMDLSLGQSQASRSKFSELSEQLAKLNLALARLRNPETRPPTIPFSESWVRQAVRHVLSEAARGGYDAVAWGTGESQKITERSSDLDLAPFYGYSPTDRAEVQTKLDVVNRRLANISFDKNAAPGAVEQATKERNKLQQQLTSKGTLTSTFEKELVKMGGEGKVRQTSYSIPMEGKEFEADHYYVDERQDDPGKFSVYDSDTDVPVGNTRFDSKREAWAWIKESAQRNVPLHLLDLSPSTRAKLAEAPKYLFQKGEEPKARTVFRADTSTIQLFKSADVSSIVHELLHVWRGQVMTPEESSKLLDAIGAKSWDKPAEEKAARLFERWVREGKASSPELSPVLTKLSSFMSSVYRQARDVPETQGGVNPKVKEFFERFLTQTEPSKRTQPEAKLPQTLAQLPSTPAHERPGVLARLFDRVRSAVDATATVVRAPSGAELNHRTIQMHVVERLLDSELEPRISLSERTLTTADRRWLDKKIDHVSQQTLAVEQGLKAPNERLQAHIDLLVDIQLTRGREAELERIQREGPGGRHEPYTQGEKPKLQRNGTPEYVEAVVSGKGHPYYDELLRLLNAHPENGTVKDIERKLSAIHEGMTRREVGALEHVREFAWFPDSIMVEGREVPMLMTEPIALATKMSHDQATAIAMHRVFGGDPIDNADAAQARAAASALGVLPKFTTKTLRDNLATAGVDPAVLKGKNFSELKLIADSLGIHKGVTKEAAVQAVNEVTDVSKLSPKQQRRLLKVAKDLDGIPHTAMEVEKSLGPTYFYTDAQGKRVMVTIEQAPQGTHYQVENTDVEGPAKWVVKTVSSGAERPFLTKADAKSYLKKLKAEVAEGWESPTVGKLLHPEQLLVEVKRRLNEEIRDDLTRLRNEAIAQGAPERDVDRHIALAQGLPYYDTSRSPVVRGLRAASQLLGSTMVSLAAIPNTLQTTLLPGYGGHTGLYLKALVDNIAHPKAEYELGLKSGAYQHEGKLPNLSVNFSIEKLTNYVSGGMARLTLLTQINNFNRRVAASYFRLLSERWNTQGMSEWDMHVAKDLDLGPAEIADIRSGKMSTLTKAKIVQRGAARTQYDTENREQRGIVESHPVLRQLFPFQLYQSGAARMTLFMMDGLGRGLKELRKGGSPKQFLVASQRMLYLLGLAAGSGVVVTAMRNALTQAPPPIKDEDLLDKALNGLIQTQVLGPATRLAMESNPYNKDTADVAMSFMPKVNAALSIVAAGYNILLAKQGETLGKLGNLPASTQAQALATRNFGAYRSAIRWIEGYTWPEEKTWREGRRLSSQFELAQGRKLSTADSQVNPDYYNVRIAVRRGDVEGAQREAAAYYKSHAKGDFVATVRNLRASLMQGRPIHVAEKDYARVIASMPPGSRGRVIRADLVYKAIVDAIAPKGS